VKRAPSFDAFEVGRVFEFREASPPYCDTAFNPEPCPTGARVIWTVYGHEDGIGVTALIDRTTKLAACRDLAKILGRPVRFAGNWATFARCPS
jgi:hypothetical protein